MNPNRATTHLIPLSGSHKRRPYIVYDIESKHDGTQAPGFTRPFMVGAMAGKNVWGAGKVDAEQYVSFRNVFDPKRPAMGPLEWDKQHLAPGGCIDRFMWWLFGDLPLEIETSNTFDPENPEAPTGFRGLTIYAHNGGSFDHLHVLPWLRAHMELFEFEVVPVQSSIQEMQVKRRGDSKALWFFRDSMKLLPMGLEKACKSFGVKGKLDHSLDLHEDHPLWDSYLRQDCIALDQVMGKVHELVEEKLGGRVGMTAPSTSMNLFRKRYLKYKIPRHVHFSECKFSKGFELTPEELQMGAKPCEGCCQEFFRNAYYGGRTELFGMMGEGLHYYDINSSYVAALCDPMPVGSKTVHEGKIDWRMRKNGWIGFAECEVDIPKCPIPPLPYKHLNGKLMFPWGRFKGTWDVDELALLDHPRVRGRIVSVGRVVWVQAKPIFRDMMVELYSYRDKSLPNYDEGLSLLAKLLGCGLYGKFGQKKERTQIIFERTRREGECFLCGTDIPTSAEICYECVGSKPAGNLDLEQKVWYREKSVDAQYIMPQISAHVTTLARVRLFEFDQQVLDKGGRLYMNDTDSLITDVEMETSTDLGMLKDEYPGELLGYMGVQPKVYMLWKMNRGMFEKAHTQHCRDKKCDGCAPWKVTMKGFPPALRTEENLITLKEALENGSEGQVVRFSRLEKVRSMAQRGFEDAPKMMDVERSFQSPYDKRIVLPDGDTEPVMVDIYEDAMAAE